MWLRQKTNCRGFTLIEALFALSFLAIVAALFPLWIRAIDHPEVVEFVSPNEKIGNLSPMEVELFFQEASMEVREAVVINVDKDLKGMTLTKYNEDKVKIEQFYSRIRRRVNDDGNEFMLYNVVDCKFERINEGAGVKIIVKGRKGNEYERIFISLVQSSK